ncbi:MAG: hypothetical protein ACRDLS_17675 [Solirubrobacteraceae bacterium]
MDDADYVLAPDGDLEDGGAAWTLTGGAAVVQSTGGLGTGQRALSLPAGSSATTAPMCIGAEHRTIRFFARNDDGSDGSLRVAARFTTPGGQTESVRVGDVREGTSWSPTEAFDSIVNRMAVAQENAMTVSWQFTPRGETRWSIDDVYIDPFRT